MSYSKYQNLNGGVLWFGAAISISEILTGALLAPLGIFEGILVIVLGHLVGCSILYFMGLIGAKEKINSMESVNRSFGRKGSIFFSILNILQLVGWTAVMIITASRAMDSIVGDQFNFLNKYFWCSIIGVFIIIWLLCGVKFANRINFIAIVSLFIILVILGIIIIFNHGKSIPLIQGNMSFGLGMELSVSLPLSWLPLISDYTRHGNKPIKFTLFSTIGYFLGSIFVFIIGISSGIYMGSNNIGLILIGVGLGVPAILVVLLSTVTTTFLDVNSAGKSLKHIFKKVNIKVVAVIFCVLGTLIGMFSSIDNYQDFLYLIGSVFAPMAAIVITDYFILKINDRSIKFLRYNFCIWIIGFLIYRIFLNLETPIGSTIPVMIIVSLISIGTYKLRSRKD